MIAGKDNNGILVNFKILHFIEESPDIIVNALAHGKILL